MQNLKILNKKEVKNILSLLENQFNFIGKLDYVFLKNNKDKIFLANKDVFDIDFKKIRINNIGLYFGQLNNGIRLSIEGSQLIGKECSKNILELNNEQKEEWMKGIDINYNGDLNGFVLIKYKEDFMGCGKITKDKILNFIPKERRLRVVND